MQTLVFFGPVELFLLFFRLFDDLLCTIFVHFDEARLLYATAHVDECAQAPAAEESVAAGDVEVLDQGGRYE